MVNKFWFDYILDIHSLKKRNRKTIMSHDLLRMLYYTCKPVQRSLLLIACKTKNPNLRWLCQTNPTNNPNSLNSPQASSGPNDSTKSKQTPKISPPPSSGHKSTASFSFFTWKRLAISVSIGVIGIIFIRYLKDVKDKQINEERQKEMGKMLIGGDWALTDPKGKTVTNKDFLGKWVLMYFGFTHCPDICPDEMEKMCKAVDIIDLEKAKNNNSGSFEVVPLFVSVDPERDTPAIVNQYCQEFSPKLVGVTGTPEQIKEMSKTFRVYYSQGPRDKRNDYIVDHTIITYLLNPKGEFVDYYGRTKTAEDIVNSVKIQALKYGGGPKRFGLF
ncbi:unnamed protein product [Gordionus sp. m RMFG-2023]